MKKNHIITIILVTLPLTSIYKSLIPISKLSIADVLLLLLFFFTLFDQVFFSKDKSYRVVMHRKYTNYEPMLLIMFFMFTTLIAALIGEYFSPKDVVIRSLRYSLLMVAVSVVGYYYFDFKYAIRLLVKISIIATIYIIIQTIVYYFFGIVLPFIIPFMKPVVSEYADISGLISWYNQFYYRPQSFFMEPSHFSQYNLVSLALCLYWKSLCEEKTRLRAAIFISIGLVLSTSSIGVIMCFFIWGMYLLNYFRSRLTLNKIILFFLLIFIVITALPYLLNVEKIMTPILRIFQATTRTTGSYSVLTNLDLLSKLIGLGLGNEKIYFNYEFIFMNSNTIVLISAGYIGFFAYLLFFLNLIVSKKGVFRVLAIILFILCSGSEIFFSYIGVVWMLFIYYGDKYYIYLDIYSKSLEKTNN